MKSNFYRMLKSAVSMVLSIIVFYFYLKLPLSTYWPDYQYTIRAWLIGIIILLIVLIKLILKIKKLDKVFRAEKSIAFVSAELSDKFSYLRNIVLDDKDDIDQVIVGPTGIWVVEIEEFKGKVTFNGQKLKRGWRPIEKDLLEKVSKKTKSIKNFISDNLDKEFNIQPVIVFSNPDTKLYFGFEKLNGIYVINGKWLNELVEDNIEQKLDRDEIIKITNLLREYSQHK